MSTGDRGLVDHPGRPWLSVSAKKAQICKKEVIYLGYILKDGQRWLTEARKETVLKIPTPTTRKAVQEFLGSAGFCRLWVPNLVELA
jgi:hypothetical protein